MLKINTQNNTKFLLLQKIMQVKPFEVLRNFLYTLFLSICLLVTFSIILWVKTKNASGFSGDYILLAYAIILTIFQLFRFTSALFFKMSLNKIKNGYVHTHPGKKYEPKVTCVIPCKNEEGAIFNTISKCYEADYPREKLEVIVINDGSTDRTGEILDELKEKYYPDLKIIHWKKNKGKRRGMNAGFRLAKGEIVVQLDSDSYIIPQTFRKLIELFENPSVGAVCAHADADNANDTWISKMQAAYYFMAFRILKAAESTFGFVFCCSGCSSAYRKKAVMPLLKPWLHESFLGQPVTWGDDRALTSYIIKSGYKTIYTDEAKAVTIVPTTFKQFITQQVRWKKSWIVNAIFTGKFIWKTDPFIAFFYYYPLIIISILTPFMAARILLYKTFTGNPNSLYLYLIGGVAITSLLVIFCKFISKEYKHWPYLFLWSFFNVFILSLLIFYSAATIQNRSWGTR